MQQQNIVDSNDVDQRFMLQDVRTDTNSTVRVQNSVSDTTQPHTQTTDITQLSQAQFTIYKKQRVVGLNILWRWSNVQVYQMVI